MAIYKIGLGPARDDAPSDPNSAAEKAIMAASPFCWFEGNNSAWIRNGELVDRARGEPLVPITGYAGPTIGQKAGHDCLLMESGTRAFEIGSFPVSEFTMTFGMYVDADAAAPAQLQLIGSPDAAGFGVVMTSAGYLGTLKSSSATFGSISIGVDLRGAWQIITYIVNATNGTITLRRNGAQVVAGTGQTGFPTSQNLQVGHNTARAPTWPAKDMGMLPPVIFPSSSVNSTVLGYVETRLGAMVGLTI